MDRHLERIGHHWGRPDGDLTLCLQRGVAFQTDMRVTAKYDADYWNKCAGYEGQEIADQINLGRIALVARHAGPTELVCDVGIGSGEFITRRGNTFGVDINPAAVMWLKEHGLWAYDLNYFAAFTFWDVVEHLPDPDVYFKHVRIGGRVFISIPLFSDLTRIRESKHYRPGEHLLYFTEDGFVSWMELHGFVLRERTDFEITAGRTSIYSFAFQRTHHG